MSQPEPEASISWNSDEGMAWMARNCERCSKSRYTPTCSLEAALIVGALPLSLAHRWNIPVAHVTEGRTITHVGGVRHETTFPADYWLARVPNACPRFRPRTRKPKANAGTRDLPIFSGAA